MFRGCSRARTLSKWRSMVRVTAIALFLVLSDHAQGQSIGNVLVGTRPLALGGAYTAVADDVNAVFYNAAGLLSLERHEATFSQADLYGTGIRTNYVAYGLPIARRLAIGGDWQHIGFGDGELDFIRNVMKVALAAGLPRGVSVGLGAKYLLTDTSLDGQSVGKGSGFGVDIGMLWPITPNLRLGASLHDVTNTGVTYEDGGSADPLPRTLRAGLAWNIRTDALVALDVDRGLHLGGEFVWRDALALRMGVKKDLRTSDPVRLTFGVGVKYRALQFDISHLPGRRGLGQTQRFGLTASFDPASSAVRVVGIESDELFASYYKTYQGQPVGEVRILNTSGKTIECRLTISTPGYETVPYRQTFIARKGKREQVVPLTVALPDEMADLTRDIALPVEVEVEYATATRTRSDKQSSKLVVYGRGAMLWDDIGRAAAFVTSRDAEVERFAREVSHAVTERSRLRSMERSLVQAAAVFEALRHFGIRYQIDPNSPYVEAIDAEWPFDNIQYPRELLERRTGDCDDCTVLYCSLLENLGIPTAVVDVPGHIFAMFDTGVRVSEIHRLGIPEDRLLAFRGSLWVPVETTLWARSFKDVWQAGLDQLRGLSDWRTRVRPIHEAWLRYPSAEPSFTYEMLGAAVTEAVEKTDLTELVANLNELKRSYVDDLYGSVLATSPRDAELRFELAYVYMSLNMTDEARGQIALAREYAGDPAQVATYLGNTHFLDGDLDRAVQHYQRALEINPEDLGIRENLNRAMLKLVEEGK